MSEASVSGAEAWTTSSNDLFNFNFFMGKRLIFSRVITKALQYVKLFLEIRKCITRFQT